MKKILLHLCCILLCGHMEIVLGAEQQTPMAAQSTPMTAQSTPTAVQATPMADRPTPVILNTNDTVWNSELGEFQKIFGVEAGSPIWIITFNNRACSEHLDSDALKFEKEVIETFCSAPTAEIYRLLEPVVREYIDKTAKERRSAMKIVVEGEFYHGKNLNSRDDARAYTAIS